MITILVRVDVKPEFVTDFIRETYKSLNSTVGEFGCMDYKMVQSDNTQFTLIETYKSQEAIDSHKKTEHFLVWRENVQHMMNTPRVATFWTIPEYQQ